MFGRRSDATEVKELSQMRRFMPFISPRRTESVFYYPMVIDAEPALAAQVEVRLELEGLTREETAGYLAQRVEVAGGEGRVLLPGAVAALHDLSEGRPGRLNTLADNALFEAFLAGPAPAPAE